MILDASAPLAKVLIEDGGLRAVLLRFAITTPEIFFAPPQTTSIGQAARVHRARQIPEPTTRRNN
jgi:hypothetical protein